MIIAHNLNPGMTIKIKNDLFKVIEAEVKAGTAKFGTMVHTKLKNLHTQAYTEQRFHPEEKLEDVTLEIELMEFIYQSGEEYCFMHPKTFEQIMIGKEKLGNFTPFMVPGIRLKCEFYEGNLVDVIIPQTVDLKVSSTGEGIKGQTDASYKSAVLENGMEILVPQFVKSGDTVRIDVETKRYIERIK